MTPDPVIDWGRVRSGCSQCGHRVYWHSLSVWCMRCGWARNWVREAAA